MGVGRKGSMSARAAVWIWCWFRRWLTGSYHHIHGALLAVVCPRIKLPNYILEIQFKELKSKITVLSFIKFISGNHPWTGIIWTSQEGSDGVKKQVRFLCLSVGGLFKGYSHISLKLSLLCFLKSQDLSSPTNQILNYNQKL